MISRLYVEKRPEFATEAQRVLANAQNLLHVEGLDAVRVLQRYDVERLSDKEFEVAGSTIFADPPLDVVLEELPTDAAAAFAVQFLPGQFDQRADSAEVALQLQNKGDRPRVENARVYLLYGSVTDADVQKIKDYLINPVESREVSLEAAPEFTTPEPNLDETPELEGFVSATEEDLTQLQADLGLAMDLDDLRFTRDHFVEVGRNPTIAEIRVIDTYWSDHCRHTTFLTQLDDLRFEDPRAQETYQKYLALRKELGRTKPVTLMDLGTIAAKYLRETGQLDGLDISEEINACTVKVNISVNGKQEPWLLLFKNETHNHPTEIEPFGGAATCVGGAIRDPLSGRAYVYQAMRITGAADPRTPLEDTLPGKLPQLQIVNQAAEGYSSYGNQIGAATGQVQEIYHPGYVAKRMELGAVVGAAPVENVVREEPVAGDVIVLLGGRTGRDGIGGATGSSKGHTEDSVTDSGAEVQKGNAPEERKIQRLFRDPEVSRMIRRCNDFGAGGVSVAIGELAPGLRVDLDKVPVKYQGLSGTELAISESQERMAVVLASADLDRFLELAHEENLEATVVAVVTEQPQLVMTHLGKEIVNLSRAFLDTNGVAKHAQAVAAASDVVEFPFGEGTLQEALEDLAGDLNVASQRGLVERFDSTVGAATVLMPLGGKMQLTPPQAMAALFPVLSGKTTTASVMAFGFNPRILEVDPYAGAYLAVVESLAKLVATGAPLDDAYLTFQEYFPRLGDDPERWGMPVSALLGALRAQLELGFAAVGGKDSMSGSFEDLDVPPTLVSFAITVAEADRLVSPEFKQSGSRIALLAPQVGDDALPTAESLRRIWEQTLEGIRRGEILSAWTPGVGGVAEGILKMAVGNQIGAALYDDAPLFTYRYGAMLVETAPESQLGQTIGETTEEYTLQVGGQSVPLEELEAIWTGTLEDVFPTGGAGPAVPLVSYAGLPSSAAPTATAAHPKFLVPIFPGTNSEYDTIRAIRGAGADAVPFIVKNLTGADVARSAERFAELLSTSHALVLPGGISGGDEPDGSAKLITSFLSDPQIRAEITALLDDRGGLIAGIDNGFQALVKLGLLPHGRFVSPAEGSLSVTANQIGRHQSRLVRTRVSSTLSPWLAATRVGDIYTMALSSGEGRIVASEAQLEQLAENGQIAAQYVNRAGEPSMDVAVNPFGSAWAVEALTSPDGRIIGKMGHAERVGAELYRNVVGRYDLRMFESAVGYFQD